MLDETLPSRPPAGMKRYKAVCQDPKVNPFNGHRFEVGQKQCTQTVDIDAGIPFAQVEQLAREAAQRDGLQFLRLETVA